MSDYSYIGSGKVYLREVGAAAPLAEVGNASALSFGVTEDVKTKEDFTQPGGGTYNEVRRITAVDFNLTMDELSPANFARSVYGSTSSISSGAVTAEAHVAYKGGFIPFDFLPDDSVPPVIKDGTDTTTYVAGTDYEVRPGGIFVFATGGAITDASTIHCAYTKAKADEVQAIVNSAKEYEVVFEGLNEARSGKKAAVRAYRVKIGAAQTIGLIGSDFAQLQVTGKLLKDTTKTGAGVSQYFKVQLEA